MLTTSLTRQIINESHFTTSPLSLSTVLSKNPPPYTSFFSKAKALCPCLNPLTAAGRADRFAKKAKAKRYHSNQKKGLCSSSFQTNPIIFPYALKARAADAPRSFPQRKKGFLPFPLRKLIGGFLPHPIQRGAKPGKSHPITQSIAIPKPSFPDLRSMDSGKSLRRLPALRQRGELHPDQNADLASR